MSRAWVAVLSFCVACGAPPAKPIAPPSTPPPVEAAYDPPAPTLRLPTHFVPKSYAARLAIDPSKATFAGSIEITGNLDRPSAAIWLHAKRLRIHAATATRDRTSVDLTATPRGDHLLELRPAAPLPAGHYVIALTYEGDVGQPGATDGVFLSTYGEDRYLTTQFEATSARTAFPCIDEPGIKVPWQLTLDVPKDQVVVGNMPEARSTPLDAAHVRVELAPTPPLPSYLIAFAIGPFEIVDAGHAASGTPLRVFAPKGQSARAAYAASVMPKIVDFLASWTDTPFPFPKLDLVVRDSGGAMENAGMITIDAGASLTDPKPTASERYGVVSVVGHETAHQWFGDLVTSAWWDDIWLNEGFATFMEVKIEVAVDPTTHDERTTSGSRDYAFAADSLATARAIREPITSEPDIHNAFDGITYIKGSALMTMLEAHVKPDVFQRAIRAYLRAHAYGNATAGDLIGAIEAASGEHLAAAFSDLADRAGLPEISAVASCTAGKPAKLHIVQRRYLVAGAPAAAPVVWRLPVCVAYERADHARGQVCAWDEAAATDVELPDSACPAWTLLDAGATVYARAAYTEAQAVALRDHAWSSMSADERDSLFRAVRAEVVDGHLSVALLMSFEARMLAGDRASVRLALGRAGMPIEPALMTPSQLAAAGARMRPGIAPLAKTLGLVARPGEDLDTEWRRRFVIGSVIALGDHTLDAQAIALAPHHRDLPTETRDLVLAIAIGASPAVEARVRADAFAEVKPDVRQELFSLLGGLRDPKRHAEVLALALDPRIKPRDILAIFTGTADPTSRAQNLTWVRAHVADLPRLLPETGGEDFPPMLILEYLLSPCDAGTRDADAAFLTHTFGAIENGARPTEQAIETMDHCIAQRALVEPSLRAWLAAH